MQNATTLLEEREEVSTAARLIMNSINRQTRIVTKQQGADRTMTDKEHVPRSIASQDVLDLANDARLRVDRPLPTPDGDQGAREKLVSDRFENVGLQETGRRPIVLVHGLAYLQLNIEFGGNDPGGLDGLPFAARDDRSRSSKPSRLRQFLRAGPTGRAQAPRGNRDRRIDLDLRMGKVADEGAHDPNVGLANLF